MLELIRLTAKGQELTLVDEQGKQTCPHKIASDVVNLIPCHFDLDEHWDYPIVYAIFSNSMSGVSEKVVLDQDGNCTVAWETLTRKGEVKVNLVAGYLENGQIIEQITSFSTQIIDVAQKVKVNADNSIPPTAEVWEQVVEMLNERIVDIEENRVISFNGRKGEVEPEQDDYTLAMVGGIPLTNTEIEELWEAN